MESITTSSRRSFLKTFAFVLAGSCGCPVFNGFLAEARASTSTVGFLKFTLDDFPALKNNSGSLLIKVPGMVASFPRIVVTRLSNNQFAAVTSKCTHQGNTVLPYNATSQVILCPVHGSEFSATGQLKRGPAQLPLTSYPTQFDGTSQVTVEIPDLGYSVAIGPVSGSGRLKLSFASASGLKYSVVYRGSVVEGAWAPVSFYLNPGDTAGQTTVTGNGGILDVYVDAPSEVGFFAVSRA